MEAKWPFMVITFVLLFLLGYTIANLERTTVMNNWASRRCELPIVVASAFFKPDDDSRTKNEFASSNFEFCMKSYFESFITTFMAPINALFGKQVNIANASIDGVNTIKSIAQALYNTLATYLEGFLKKFNASIFEMSRIIQYLRMAVKRANAIAVSMIYTGFTMLRGMINAIQVVIRVVLIICAIMLVIIIILWFILFPVIPIILGTLAAVISVVIAMSVIMSQSLAAQAETHKTGFCFAEGTMILVKDKSGTTHLKQVKDIVNGDELGNNCGKVTSVIKMDGKDIPLYNLDGIFVSGSHLVQGLHGQWQSVSNDERAILTTKTSAVLYCFNTTTNTIPVYTKDSILLFRDWEELDNEDEEGQTLWNEMINTMLNKGTVINEKKLCNDPLIGRNVLVKTSRGFLPIFTIKLGDDRILDMHGNPQCVKGVIYGEVEDAKDTHGTWIVDLYEYSNGSWINLKGTLPKGTQTIQGMSLITESGTYIIWDEASQREIIVRDFTEVGYQHIHETYSFTEARLRITNPITQP